MKLNDGEAIIKASLEMIKYINNSCEHKDNPCSNCEEKIELRGAKTAYHWDEMLEQYYRGLL